MKVGLGSAQFGLDYGVANPQRMTSTDAVREILLAAATAGIGVVDTAPAYGIAEKVLGQCWPSGATFRVVTKTPTASSGGWLGSRARRIRGSLLESLKSLRLGSVYGLLVHDPQHLLGPDADEVYEALQALKAERLVQKIGMSAYTGEQIDRVVQHHDLDLIQVPLSVLDQRLLQGGQLDRLKARGVEVHARSVFLQGLLLMDADSVPGHFRPIRDHLARYRDDCSRHGLTALQAAVAFVQALPQVDTLVCGVNAPSHLREIIQAANATPDTSWMGAYALHDPAMLNPSLWPARA